MARQTAKRAAGLTSARDGRGNPKRNRCLQCRVTFKPARSGAKYCGAPCRQAAYRARHRKPETLDHPARCAHCGAGYWSTSLIRKYCSGSCRTLASRARRLAAIEALATWQGLSVPNAEHMIDVSGLVLTRQALETHGFQYDQNSRQWVTQAAG